MIQIRNAFFDDDFYWGIVPCGNYDTDRYVVALRSGEKLNITAEPAEILSALEAAGHVAIEEDDLSDTPMLTIGNSIELASAAAAGYRFIAADIRGYCYAFINEPVKQGAYWADPDGAPARRIYTLDGLPVDEAKPIEEYLKPLQN